MAINLAERLALSYSALLDLLFPGSERDSPYLPFSADHDPDAPITADSFRHAAQLADWWLIDLSSGSKFLTGLEASSADPDIGNDPDAAAAYRALHQTMRATLTSPLHAVTARAAQHVGFHTTRRFVIGKTPDQGLAGVVTLSVET